MDTKYKALLQQHRPFLARNVIWSSQFSDMLKAHGLVTDFMIKDINSCSTREEKIHRLIDVIPLKGTSAFHKFLDVLMMSGHVFISDFLREDEEHQKLFDVKEMYKALPFVQRAFNDTEKKAIESFVAERIQNQVLKLLWKRDDREKDKALEAKMKQIEQSYEFEEHQHTKAATIHKLEKEIDASLENKQELKAKISALTNAHREMEAQHKEAMAVQMRFNAANDNAIEKSKQTIGNLENLLRSMHTHMDALLKKNVNDFPKDLENTQINGDKPKPEKPGNLEKDSSVYKNNFGFVMDDLNKLTARYHYLLELKLRHDTLLEEKEYILIHFGFPQTEAAKKKAGGNRVSIDGEPTMVKAYKEFCVRNDESMDKMKKQIEEYDGLLEENKAKLQDLAKEKDETSKKMATGVSAWQGAIMNVMRKQLQDMKTDARKKESMMAMQEEETTKLKNKIIELENRLACAAFTQPGGDSLSVIQSRDMADGRISAVSNDSVELITSETPKPGRNKNLPPLKSSSKPNHHYPNKGGSGSPHGTVMRSKPNLVPPRVVTEPVKSFITFPIGPISSQIKPADVRGRPMGSVLGDLKAMNKHHNKPSQLENPKSAWKQQNGGSASFIK